jgi:hypothetical protein
LRLGFSQQGIDRLNIAGLVTNLRPQSSFNFRSNPLGPLLRIDGGNQSASLYAQVAQYGVLERWPSRLAVLKPGKLDRMQLSI